MCGHYTFPRCGGVGRGCRVSMVLVRDSQGIYGKIATRVSGAVLWLKEAITSNGDWDIVINTTLNELSSDTPHCQTNNVAP